MMLFFVIFAVPVSATVMGLLERHYGEKASDKVLSTGTASVTRCEKWILLVPYRCEAVVEWQATQRVGEPPTQVTVRSVRPLSGTIAVEERDCGRGRTSPKCPVYAAGDPHLDGFLSIMPYFLLVVLLLAGWIPAKAIATRFVTERPGGAGRR